MFSIHVLSCFVFRREQRFKAEDCQSTGQEPQETSLIELLRDLLEKRTKSAIIDAVLAQMSFFLAFSDSCILDMLISSEGKRQAYELA